MKAVRLVISGLSEKLRWLRSSQAPLAQKSRRAFLWLIFICVALGAVLTVLLQTPSTLVAAELSTESVQFRVTAPQSAAIALRKAIWEEKGSCLSDVFVEPQVGATVWYTRPGRDALQILINGPVILTHQDGKEEASQRLKTLSLLVTGGEAGPAKSAAKLPVEPGGSEKMERSPEAITDGCGDTLVQRLPIEGDNVIFGAYPLQLTGAKDVPLRLLGGRLTVYGRARSHVLGIRFLPDAAKQALYVAGEFALPGGTVIEDRVSTDEGADRQRTSAIWAGFADTNFKSDSSLGLTVHASTNTGTVSLYLPAPNLGPDVRKTSDPETVSISLMARLIGDPHLLLIYGFLGLVALGLGLVNAIREILNIRGGDS
jgi:hypothetical protein